MLSINTNLSSLIAQNSLKSSTLKLNQAIEKMSTGYKINHAKDNAANYSISTNMTTKIGAYQIAQDNVSMGLDLLSTADESLNLISDKLARLRALAEQATNGTYGEQSLKNINSEANAIIDETNRIFNTAEYNGQKLFGHSSRFLEDITTRDTSNMDKLESVDINSTITSGTYSISSAEELAKLATMSNSGNIQGGEFVLANDIDLSDYSTGKGWTPIGTQSWSEKHFNGTFDGNGHIVSNLYINRPDSNQQGLFGCAEGTIKNLGVENADITAYHACSAIVGATYNNNITIQNCYATGKIQCGRGAGIIASVFAKEIVIKDCYSDIEIFAESGYCGGIFGSTESDNINMIMENCFSLGDISSQGYFNGGLIGYTNSYNSNITIKNCYSNSNINSTNTDSGGLIGRIETPNGTGEGILNCYSTGNITSSSNGGTGGFIGTLDGIEIKHCYSTGNVTAQSNAGGFIGRCNNNTSIINNCYSTGSVNGTSELGSFIGTIGNSANITIKDSYALSKGQNVSGIFVAQNLNADNLKIENSKYSSSYAKLNIPLAGGNVDTDNITNNKEYSGNTPFKIGDGYFELQVGINQSASSQIAIDTSFSLYKISELYNIGLEDRDFISIIDELMQQVSEKQIEIGVSQNRLESALDEIVTQSENLISSRSTLRDADIANVSSEYIKQQILQQASATLLATANQSPSIALQLL